VGGGTCGYVGAHRWLQHCEGAHVRLFLGGVGAAGCEGHADLAPTLLGCRLDSRTAAEHKQVRQRHRFGKAALDGLERLERLRELRLPASVASQYFLTRTDVT
jgi:hypothetical protein